MEEEEEPEVDRIAYTIDGAFWAGVEGGQERGSVKEQIDLQAAREFAQGETVEDGERVRYREGRRVEIETLPDGLMMPTLDCYLQSTLHLLRYTSILCTASRSDNPYHPFDNSLYL
jgi:hypothetical protein